MFSGESILIWQAHRYAKTETMGSLSESPSTQPDWYSFSLLNVSFLILRRHYRLLPTPRSAAHAQDKVTDISTTRYPFSTLEIPSRLSGSSSNMISSMNYETVP